MARTLNLNTNSDELLQQQAQWNHDAEQAHWDALAQRNAKANALNAQLEQRQQSMLDGSYNDNLLFAANDRAKARKNAEMETPLYKAEQLKGNLQSAGRALQDAQTTQGYTYNGLDAYQKPDGSYFVRDAQGNDIVPKEQLQPKTSIDRGQALLSMLQAGNPQAMALYAATQDKETGKLPFEQQLALKTLEVNAKKDIAESKPKPTLKPKQVGDMLTNILGKNPTDEDRSLLTTQLQGAKDEEERNAILSAAQQSLIEPSWGNSFRGGIAGAGVGGAATLGNPLGFAAGGLVGALAPLMAKRHINQDKLTELMAQYQKDNVSQ